MSVLKNLKAIFITEEPVKDKQEPEPQEGPAPKPETPHSTASGKADEKILTTLLEAIEANNLGGFDYIEFKRSVKGLEKMVADEAMRFKSAFATASTMDVTLDKLVETAQYYLNILDKERDKFTQAAAGQTRTLVDNRKEEIRQMMAAMERKREEMARLQHELSESESRLELLQRGIDTASQKIEETKRNFDVSFNQLKQQIGADIDKMKNYLR